MDKGIFLIIAIGAAIIIFATNFSGDKDFDGDISWSNTSKDRLPPYYKKDVLGNYVLNVSSISLDEAKKIWPSTPVAKKVASTLPDFDMARLHAENDIEKGKFREYVMKYLDTLEGRFVVGDMHSDQVKKALLSLP